MTPEAATVEPKVGREVLIFSDLVGEGDGLANGEGTSPSIGTTADGGNEVTSVVFVDGRKLSIDGEREGASDSIMDELTVGTRELTSERPTGSRWVGNILNVLESSEGDVDDAGTLGSAEPDHEGPDDGVMDPIKESTGTNDDGLIELTPPVVFAVGVSVGVALGVSVG